METVSQEPVQETKDPEWQKVETKRTKKKKNKEKNGPKKKVQTEQLNRRLRSDALVIKPTEGKTYADVLSKVKKDSTIQEVGLAVAGVQKLRRYRAMFILSQTRIIRAKPEQLARRLVRYSAEMQPINARMQKITLEVTRLYGTTTKDEVYEA